MKELELKLMPDDVPVNFCLATKENFVEGEVEPSFVILNYLVFVELFPFAIRSRNGSFESMEIKWGELKNILNVILSNRNVA